jgi:hypothetical protein
VQCVMCCQENFPMLALVGGLGETRVLDPKSPSRDIYMYVVGGGPGWWIVEFEWLV